MDILDCPQLDKYRTHSSKIIIEGSSNPRAGAICEQINFNPDLSKDFNIVVAADNWN